jgi:hypothetical protein
MLGPLSVHTYCENRPIVGALTFVAAFIFTLFIRKRSDTFWKRILSGLGVAMCLLTTGVNIWFNLVYLVRDPVVSSHARFG